MVPISTMDYFSKFVRNKVFGTNNQKPNKNVLVFLNCTTTGKPLFSVAKCSLIL